MEAWASTCILAWVGSELQVKNGDGKVRDLGQQTAFLLSGLKIFFPSSLTTALIQRKSCQSPLNITGSKKLKATVK